MIYTSYYANLKNLPDSIVPIAISAGVPKHINIIQYKKLAPSYKILNRYKRNNDITEYIKDYTEEVLNKLNPNEVVNDLYTLSNGNDIALICYEKYNKFCHRQIVASWLNINNIEVKEYIV